MSHHTSDWTGLHECFLCAHFNRKRYSTLYGLRMHQRIRHNVKRRRATADTIMKARKTQPGMIGKFPIFVRGVQVGTAHGIQIVERV
jgi:hypothetical protein